MPRPDPSSRSPLARRVLPVCLGGLALLGSGCAAVAAGGIGMILSQEFQQGAQIVHYDHDAERVWSRVKQTLAHLSTRRPEFDDENRVAAATVDSGTVQVAVIELEPGSCRMAVKARRYGLQSSALAEIVMDRLHEEIDG